MREGYSTWSVCLSVCLCVCVFPILAPRAIRRTNSSISDFSVLLQHDTGMKYKKGFFLKMLRSEVMASFAYRDSPRRHSSALELAFSTTEYYKVV